MTDEAKMPTAEETQEAHEVTMLQKAVDTGIAILPEQFKTAKELVDSYKNLQGHATKLAQENATLKKTPEKKETPPVVDLAAAVAPIKPVADDGKSIDWGAVQDELRENNDLSPETRALLEAKQIPTSMIDAQVSAHQIKREADAKAAADMVGGQQQLQDLLEWSKKNMSAADLETLSSQFRGPGWKLALMGLKGLKDSKLGSKETAHLTAMSGAGGGSSSDLKPYETKGEMTAAIRDPRYKNDAEYRHKVEHRLRLSYGKPG